MKKLLTLLILLCAVFGEHAQAQTTYSVIGTINGSWDTDTDMSDTDGDGIYTATFQNKAATTYEFKVRENHDWTVSYGGNGGGGNYVLTIPATANVTVYFNSNNGAVYTSTGNKPCYVYILKSSDTAPYIYVWSANGDDTRVNHGTWPGKRMTQTETINGVEYWKAGPFENSQNYTWETVGIILSNNGANQTDNIWKTGYFVCAYDGTSSSAYDELPRVVGGVADDWSLGYPMTKSSSNYVLTCTPPWNKAEYKIVLGSTWYGYGSESTNITAPDDYAISTSGNNMAIRLARPVTFTLNTSTWNLNVATDDNDLSLDYFSATDNATYNTTTHEVQTTANWKGINQWIGTEGNTQNDFLAITTSSDVKLSWWVTYNDGLEDSSEHAANATSFYESVASQKHFCPIKNYTIESISISLVEAGATTYSNLYDTSKRSVTLNSDGTNGWATFAAASPVSFANQDNVQVNIITKDGNVLRKAEVASKEVPAGSAVLLYYEGLTSGTSVNVPVLNAAPAALDGSNVLLSSGAEGLAVTEAKRYYILGNGTSGVGFYPVQTSTTIAAYKGYIDFGTSGSAPKFLWFDEETTAIDALNNESETPNDGAVYDLSGRKVNGQLHRGIYVQNGKKFIVK